MLPYPCRVNGLLTSDTASNDPRFPDFHQGTKFFMASKKAILREEVKQPVRVGMGFINDWRQHFIKLHVNGRNNLTYNVNGFTIFLILC